MGVQATYLSMTRCTWTFCWVIGLLWLLWVENACCKVSSLSSAFRLEYGCLPRLLFMLEWHPLLFTEDPILFCSYAKGRRHLPLLCFAGFVFMCLRCEFPRANGILYPVKWCTQGNLI